MFFPRLRSQAKWAFVFLILVFAGGFVFLGVGSGGLDLGSLIRDAFGRHGGSSGSVSDAQKKVQQRPYNAIARQNAPALSLETMEAVVGDQQEIDAAFAQFVQAGADGLYIAPSPLLP